MSASTVPFASVPPPSYIYSPVLLLSSLPFLSPHQSSGRFSAQVAWVCGPLRSSPLQPSPLVGPYPSPLPSTSIIRPACPCPSEAILLLLGFLEIPSSYPITLTMSASLHPRPPYPTQQQSPMLSDMRTYRKRMCGRRLSKRRGIPGMSSSLQ